VEQLKFAPAPAGGTIEVCARQCEDQVDLIVTDQGPGISPEDRAYVFEPFYRGQTLANGLVKGTGIGLSIVKDHVQAHGGSVEIIENVPGTQLRVRLPLLRLKAQA